MKKTIVIIGLLTVSLWAEKCEYFPYNENYTRETVYDHIVTVIADDEFGCELDTRDIEAYDKGIFFTAQLDHIVNSGNRVIKLMMKIMKSQLFLIFGESLVGKQIKYVMLFI